MPSSVWGARGLLVFIKLLLQVEMIMVTLILVAAFRVVPEFDPHKRLTWRLGGGFLAILASSVYLSPAPAGSGGERRAAPIGR